MQQGAPVVRRFSYIKFRFIVEACTIVGSSLDSTGQS